MITSSIQKIVKIVASGGIIGLPTETVYGLAANAYNPAAIQKIFVRKGRPLTNPLIVHIGNRDQVNDLVTHIPDLASRLMEAFWPGPLTIVLPKNERIPSIVTAGQDTVALRMPNHVLCRELLQSLPFPLVAPSANPYMSVSSTMASHVDGYFPDILTLDGGACDQGIESTIVGFDADAILVYRLGSISMEELSEFAPCQFVGKKAGEIITPGMATKHYSPATPLIHTATPDEEIKKYPHLRIGLILFQNNPAIVATKIHVLSPEGDLKKAAQQLYATMISLDQEDLDLLVVEKFPDTHVGRALNDRLSRAQKK